MTKSPENLKTGTDNFEPPLEDTDNLLELYLTSIGPFELVPYDFLLVVLHE